MKVALLSPDQRAIERIAVLIEQGELPAQISRFVGPLAQVGDLLGAETPDVLIVDQSFGAGDELEAIERLRVRLPALFVILCVAQESRDLLVGAMRAGVRELLPAPVGVESLTSALRRAQATRHCGDNPQRARLLALIGAKGGAGTTFVAANLAHVLAQRGSRVLLMDLDVEFGDALLALHETPPTIDIGQVARTLDRLDAALLAGAVVQVSPRLHVLGASIAAVGADPLSVEQLEAILRAAGPAYDLIVVDLPRRLDAAVMRAMALADQVLLVLNARVPHIRSAGRMRQLLHTAGVGPEKLWALVNRYQRSIDLSIDEIRPLLEGLEIVLIGEDEREVARAVDLGVPLAELSQTSVVNRHLQALAQLLRPLPRVRRAGVLDRLLGRVRGERQRSEAPSLEHHG